MYLIHYLSHKWYDHSKTTEGFRVVRERPSFEDDKERIKSIKAHNKWSQKRFKNIHADRGYSEIIRFAKIADKINWQYPSK